MKMLAKIGKAVVVLAVLFVPMSALAHLDIAYHSHHPIPHAFGGGFCHGEGVHAHEYAPEDPEYFNVIDGVYYYIGDPTWYGEDVVFEELVWYEYHHPVPTLWGGGYCYIWGPHRHWWLPYHGHSRHYVVVNGRHVYRGPWGKRYYKKKKLRPPASRTTPKRTTAPPAGGADRDRATREDRRRDRRKDGKARQRAGDRRDDNKRRQRKARRHKPSNEHGRHRARSTTETKRSRAKVNTQSKRKNTRTKRVRSQRSSRPAKARRAIQRTRRSVIKRPTRSRGDDR